ncbi:MAG: hypothetical protein PCFJNLEI_04086 [Verrucomicrobiae bacterium]|nr:hypothetical protein [Verrucomicrobiae bacterium]
MSQNDYMATDDLGKASLFTRFATDLPAQFTVLGLSPADPDVAQQVLDSARFRALVDFGSVMQGAAQAWTATKNYERDGGDTTPSGQTLPVLPVGFPAAVPPGIVPRFRALVKRVKACPGYTVAIGETLGIERPHSQAASDMDSEGPQPVLRGRGLDTGGAEIKSTKGAAEAVDLYCQRDGEAAPSLLVRCLHFPYIDTRPLLVAGKPEKRTYTGMFIRHNQPYGRMSASITVIVSA